MKDGNQLFLFENISADIQGTHAFGPMYLMGTEADKIGTDRGRRKLTFEESLNRVTMGHNLRIFPFRQRKRFGKIVPCARFVIDHHHGDHKRVGIQLAF